MVLLVVVKVINVVVVIIVAVVVVDVVVVAAVNVVVDGGSWKRAKKRFFLSNLKWKKAFFRTRFITVIAISRRLNVKPFPTI